MATTIALGTQAAEATVPFPVASLNGSGNNVANPAWGQVGSSYLRVGPVRYANGRNTPVGENFNARVISNRVFNDINQNVFSEVAALCTEVFPDEPLPTGPGWCWRTSLRRLGRKGEAGPSGDGVHCGHGWGLPAP